MAGIGFGMQGPANMRSFLGKPEVQWVAVCDLDDVPLGKARDTVNEQYGNKDCATYKDYRELFARGDLDAVSIAVPDHWHAILSIAAVRAGLDVFGEKPFTHSLREGRALCDAVQALRPRMADGQLAALGGQLPPRLRARAQRARREDPARRGRAAIRLYRFRADLRAGEDREPRRPGSTTTPGSARRPWSPYCKARVHMNWRWNMDYGGGQLMDWIGHHLDIAHWGLGLERTGPVEISGKGEFPTTGIYNGAKRFWVDTKYADGTPIVIAGGYPEIQSGTKWIGEYGWVWVDRGGFESQPAHLVNEVIGPNETRIYRSRDHFQNFLDCVRSRALTIAPAEVAHRSASVGHLGVIAIETGRTIKWDPATETIIGDPAAERLLSRSYRKPYQIPA